MSTQTHRLIIHELARCDECAVLRVSGELDRTAEKYFLRTLGESVMAGHRHLVLDVTALVFCDSRGLNCLLGVRWLLRRREGQLLLAGAGRHLVSLLTLTGSADMFPRYLTVGQALHSLPPSHRPAWPPSSSAHPDEAPSEAPPTGP
ncbi:STAS domain-containing protein [Streptomyces longisporoflavus]|uniref:STAS domain-containing protein n=1 Tax=Streptomyces longisporoflavus TaxID=28044 RepID=A0ABW7QGH5_9ACTN